MDVSSGVPAIKGFSALHYRRGRERAVFGNTCIDAVLNGVAAGLECQRERRFQCEHTNDDVAAGKVAHRRDADDVAALLRLG